MTLFASEIKPLVVPSMEGTERRFLNGVAVGNTPAATPGVTIEEAGKETRVVVAPGSEATWIEIYSGAGEDPYSTQTKTRISLGAGARLTHYKLVRENSKAQHHSFLEIDVQQSAVFESHVFLWGGAQVRNTLHVRLVGEGAECSLNGLYLGHEDDVIENHTLIDHLKPHGTSREFYKGILDDQSRGIFDGLIIVEKDAQKTDSTQTNRNLLLSNEAHAQSNPELKIFANDVKCKHGATIGQLNPEALFYLRSRGISLEEARRLLITAFGSEMIGRVPFEPLRQMLEAELFQTFQTHV